MNGGRNKERLHQESTTEVDNRREELSSGEMEQQSVPGRHINEKIHEMTPQGTGEVPVDADESMPN